MKAAVILPAILCLSACSTTPRVTEVSSKKRLEKVMVADQEIFLHDRASLIHLENEVLPPKDRRQEFLVRWSGTGVDEVKFEYRQADVPDKISEQTYTPAGQHWTVFEIRGDDYVKGGPISAWRVSLWQDSQLVAEKKSLLW